MTIENEHLYMAGVWDWAILDGCFGGTIKPTDIDGTVERNGHFLFLETKKPGTEIKDGQRWYYEGQVASGATVVFIWGEQNQPQRLLVMTPNTTVLYDPADLKKLREVCVQWYEWANKQPHPLCRLPVDPEQAGRQMAERKVKRAWMEKFIYAYYKAIVP